MECEYTHWPSLQNPSLQQRAAFFLFEFLLFRLHVKFVSAWWCNDTFQSEFDRPYTVYINHNLFPLTFSWDKVPSEFVRAKLFVLFCFFLASAALLSPSQIQLSAFDTSRCSNLRLQAKMIINGWLFVKAQRKDCFLHNLTDLTFSHHHHSFPPN